MPEAADRSGPGADPSSPGPASADEGAESPAHPRHDVGHAVAMGLSTGGNAFLGFAGGILMVRGLTVPQYGLVSSALSAVLVAQELVGRGINDSMVRLGTAGVAGSEERAGEVFRAGFLLKALLCALCAAAAVVLGTRPGLTARLLGTSEINRALPGMVAAVAGYALWTFVLTRWQARLRFRRLALLQPLANLLKVALLLSAMALGALTWTGAVWLTAASLLAGSALLGLDSWREMVRLPWGAGRVLEAVRDVWSLARWNILAAVAYVASNRMDVFVLGRLTDSTQVAVYNAAWQVLVIVDLCTITIMSVMIPKASGCTHYEDLVAWSRRTVGLGAAAAVGTLALFLFADWYVPLLFGAHYAPSASLLRVMYPGSVVSLVLLPLVGVLHARKAVHVNSALQVALLAASVPAYHLAVHWAGAAGAARATLGLRLASGALLGIAAFAVARGAPRRSRASVPAGAGAGPGGRGP